MQIFGKNKYERRKNYFIFAFFTSLIVLFFLFFANLRKFVIDFIFTFDIFKKDSIEDKMLLENSILQNKITDLLNQNQILRDGILLKDGFAHNYIPLTSIISDNVFYNSALLKVNTNVADIDNNIVNRLLEGDIIYVAGLYPVGIIEKIENKNKGIIKMKLFSYKDFSFTILLEDLGNQNNGLDTNITKSSSNIIQNSSSSEDIEKDIVENNLKSSQNSNVYFYNKKYFYDIGATGDGMYGVYAYLPKNKKVIVGQKVYYKENTKKEIGEISGIEFIEKENLQKIYIKTYYKDNQDSYFFVKGVF